MWGSPIEIERKLRIQVCVWAYAYEIMNDSFVTDSYFDYVARLIDLAISTGDAEMDNWFRINFQCYTGSWIHNHPHLDRIKSLYERKAFMQEPSLKTKTDLLMKVLDAHTADIYDDGHRWHLGASQIGDSCSRKLWYNFRWVHTPDYVNNKGENHKGRMMRLFNRGHSEEIRLVAWLRGIGCVVEEFDPESRLIRGNESGRYFVFTAAELKEGKGEADPGDSGFTDVTGDIPHQEEAMRQGIKRKQLRISGVHGHYGGSLDAIIKLPIELGGESYLGEFKTAGDKYFEKLKSEGVISAKPVHYAQMCSYGKRYGLSKGLYICVNKNTDEIYMEIVELNPDYSDKLTAKAEAIITANVPPVKLSESSAYYECKFCDYFGVCHNNRQYEKNCRSCRFAAPMQNGEWACAYYGQIPRDFVKKGCDNHQEVGR